MQRRLNWVDPDPEHRAAGSLRMRRMRGIMHLQIVLIRSVSGLSMNYLMGLNIPIQPLKKVI